MCIRDRHHKAQADSSADPTLRKKREGWGTRGFVRWTEGTADPSTSLPRHAGTGGMTKDRVVAHPTTRFISKSAGVLLLRRRRTTRSRHVDPSVPCRDRRRPTRDSPRSSEPDGIRENLPPRRPGRRCWGKSAPGMNPSQAPFRSAEPSRSWVWSTWRLYLSLIHI